MFFLKQRPYKITAYTSEASVYDYCKPSIGKEKLPDIFTSVPKYQSGTARKNYQEAGITVDENDPRLNQLDKNKGYASSNLEATTKLPTIATCPGIKDFYQLPIHLKMWGEAEVHVKPDGKWSTNINPALGIQMTYHSSLQYGKMYSDRIFVKMESPWYFSSDDDVNVMFMESHYSASFFRDNDLIVPPGILNFKYQPGTNVHIGYKIKEQPYAVKWKLNQPLVSMFALTERPVVIEHKLISHNDWQTLVNFPKCNIGRYFKKLQILKEMGKNAPSPDTHLKERSKK